MDFLTGKTKTYRLMKENHLLLPRKKRGTREFVRFPGDKIGVFTRMLWNLEPDEVKDF